MLAYTQFVHDARVRREAETLVSLMQYHVVLLVPRSGARPRKYTRDGLNIVEVNVRQYQGKSKLRYFFSYVSFALVCGWFCARQDLSVVAAFHVHNMPNFLVFAAVVPKLLGRPIVLDVHDTMPETYAAKFGRARSWLYWPLVLEETISCAIADTVIAVNHVQKQALVNRGVRQKKIDISMNVPDHRRFGTRTPVLSEQPKPVRLVYHGTLARRLGIDIAIKAVAELAKEEPDIELNLIGAGDDAIAFRRLSEQLGVASVVRFAGPLPLESIPGILQSMNIGIVANRRSSATDLMLPVKMLEYVALGIPVVAPRLRAVQYYFDETMVAYFEPDDEASMIGAILRLLSDPSIRVRKAQAAQRFLSEYGWEKQQWGLVELYTRLIGSRKDPFATFSD